MTYAELEAIPIITLSHTNAIVAFFYCKRTDKEIRSVNF